jgi:hypothetical protein
VTYFAVRPKKPMECLLLGTKAVSAGGLTKFSVLEVLRTSQQSHPSRSKIWSIRKYKEILPDVRLV